MRIKDKLPKVSGLSVVSFFLTGLLLWFFIKEKFEAVSHLPENDECIDSFDTFVYTFPDVDGPVQEEILPLSPWQAVSSVPVEGSSNQLEVTVLRTVAGSPEIWLSKPPSNQVDSFLVYQPDVQKWQIIPSQIANSKTTVESIHVSRDQSIWGISLEMNPHDYLTSRIVFSIFDDASKRFVERYTQEIPSDWSLSTKSEEYMITELGPVLWDPNEIFWIFSGGDAIYTFDPLHQQLKRHSSLEEYRTPSDLVHDPNRHIFFHTLGATYQYTIATEKITEIDTPNETLLGIKLVDHAGNLWMNDGYGWQAPEGEWQTLHPDPINYWWYQDVGAYWRYYSPPDPFFESSDGRIWFRAYRSNEGNTLRSGMAWFDPTTREGCWFTTEGAQIVEDTQQNLWMVINNVLYKHKLNLE